jgi:hypothetical protein
MNLEGKWKVLKHKSSDIDYYQSIEFEFSIKKGEITFAREFGPRRKYQEKMVLKTDGSPRQIKIEDPTVPTNIFMALQMPVGDFKEVSARWQDQVLVIQEKFKVQVGQGPRAMEIQYLFKAIGNHQLLECRIRKSSRQGEPDLVYILKKTDFRNAYYMTLNDNWEINGNLPEQACLISLQGLANAEKPNLYFIYGPEWPFNYVQDLYDFLVRERYFTFTRLNSLDQALNTFKEQVKGYIVWDKHVRTSLIVAYTLAGLEKGIVITEEMIPLAEKHGLKLIEDYRGKFTGKSDYEIFAWAYDHYWPRCSKEFILWLGGEHGNVLKPGVADFGMQKQVFFTDLSARISDTLEFALTNKLLSEMKPLGHVMGWHSYKKDWEEEWVTVTSSHALTVDGLNTLPNTSFLYKVPPTPGFQYKNQHNIQPGKKYIPEQKVYLSFIQTDGLGIGAWVKPGRGSIPYAWEVSMNMIWMSPCMIEYFYSQATPNDYFIGCLSGSAYMYPKAFPKKWLPKELDNAYNMMQKLDLKVFEIMDYSEDRTEAGKNDLPKSIVDEYYKAMPGAIGFINGYFASHTYTVRNGVPFLSYDYYLAKEKPEADVVSDLKELTAINPDRPYFLLVHVRESSEITRVKSICDQFSQKLGKNLEIVPLDIFLKMAEENPTYKEWFLKK